MRRGGPRPSLPRVVAQRAGRRPDRVLRINPRHPDIHDNLRRSWSWVTVRYVRRRPGSNGPGAGDRQIEFPGKCDIWVGTMARCFVASVEQISVV